MVNFLDAVFDFLEDRFKTISNGFTSVMMDGSLEADAKTPATYEYNVNVTAEVVKVAHSIGASVEGELGCLGSDGSQQEGNDAEAARLAVAQHINVKLIIDDNDVTIAGNPSKYLPGYDVAKTLTGHGLKVLVGDGEDIDSLSDRYGNGTLRVTTRQGFQLHGILKKNLKATLGSDYNDPSLGQATFAAGSSTATITLPTIDDSVVDPSETIISKITAPAGYTISGPDTATATIIDNDFTTYFWDDFANNSKGWTLGTEWQPTNRRHFSGLDSHSPTSR